MPELSPAAQAVLDAVASSLEGGWISPEFVPYESRKIAAALEALADQAENLYDTHEGKVSVVRVDQILRIAAELRGGPMAEPTPATTPAGQDADHA